MKTISNKNILLYVKGSMFNNEEGIPRKRHTPNSKENEDSKDSEQNVSNFAINYYENEEESIRNNEIDLQVMRYTIGQNLNVRNIYNENYRQNIGVNTIYNDPNIAIETNDIGTNTGKNSIFYSKPFLFLVPSVITMGATILFRCLIFTNIDMSSL